MTNSLDDFYDKYTPEKDSTMREFVKRKRDELLCHKLYYHDRTGKVHILPITKWLCKYNCEWFKKDFIAGITVAILLVPQSLAYAQLAGLPPEWGLYASIIPLIIYTLLGTSTQVSIGPVAPTAIMVSSCIEDILKDFNNKNEDMPKYELLAMMVSFNVGLILFIFGIFRAGRFITIFLSKPIMTGFISAAALIIFIEQVKGLLGMKIGRFHLFSETLMAIIENLSTTHALTCAISFPSLFILFIPKLGKCISCISKIPKWIKIPIPLFVILINILLSYFLDFESYGIIIVGSDIQKGFPTPIIPHYKYFIQTFFGAFIVAIVSYMGSLALATQFEQQINNNYKKQLQDYYNGTSQLAVIRKMPTRQIALAYNEWEKGAGADDLEESLLAPVNMNNMNSVNGRSDAIDENGKPVKKPIPIPLLKINANSEFIAYGLANMIGAFFGSQAVSASFSRSALNFEMNAYTAMSMVIQATICLLCLLFAMPLLSPLPKCILSALVTVSVYRLINNGITEFKFLYAVSKIELFEFSVALIAPLIVGLEMGIFVAIFSSIFVNFILRNSSVCVKVNHLIDVANNDQNNDNDNENNNNVFVTQTLYNQIVNQTDNTYDNDNSNINDNIIMIELNAQMSYINSKQLIKTLQQLISAERNKHILYIIISLNLTAFVDTTTLRQICSLFQDLKTANKYIAFANCKLSVINSFKKYEKVTKKSFQENNIKLFVSNNDAITYFKNINDNENP